MAPLAISAARPSPGEAGVADRGRAAGSRKRPVAATRDPAAADQRRRRRTLVRVLIGGMILVALLFVFVFPARTLLAQRQKTEEQRKTLELLQQQSSKLEEESRRLQNDAEVERMAREQYGFVYPGEPVRRRATVDDGAAGVHHNDETRQEALTRQSGARGAALSRPCPEASTQAESGGGFGGAGLVEPTNATGQLAQEIARERRRLLEDALEPAGVDHVHLHGRAGDDRRRPGAVVDQAHLADDAAGADRADHLVADLHVRLAVVDDEGGGRHLALAAQDLTRLQDGLVGDARQARQLLGRAVPEQRDLAQPP